MLSAIGEIGAAVHADAVVLLANVTEYGGCSISPFVTVTRDPSAVRILAHELGHRLFQLADEYEGGGVACDRNRLSGPANVAGSLDTLPWADLINVEALPTPLVGAPADAIGAFEGARYCSEDAYRPQATCLMRSLAADYCSVCRREVERFFERRAQ